ncbi:hypothetical protein, variant 1 [Aphanomyces astaci]|uniref:Autophagy protein ATG17-like domain-containing protein n=1 Tax=Aphanomyces astaci TaxID=112090 RepID=W4HA80_APHAT|nr:hypothetical protein, variant 1 [Aphanomyces astaci]ETV88164.1 hypothetical protein, variant 1 [Aphanomyces astaci]|eukprot:XP_009823027.1 hypothetical protein, variant 1 [Aphanomyces astaci]
MMDHTDNAATGRSASLIDGQLERDGHALAANYERCITFRMLLQEISATMTMRIQAVESSLGVSEGAFETQDAAVQDMIQAHQQVEEDLRAIFTALKHQRVDPAMVSGEVGKSLFDFVDADTVMDLQRQAQSHIHTIVESRHNTVDSLELLRATMSFYQGLDFNGMVPLSSDGQSVWDALGDLCQHLQDELFECKLRHTSLQETRHHAAVDRITEDSSALVKASSTALNHLTELYDVALLYFVDMEQCDRRILHTFSAMHDTSQAYDAALSECHVLLDELTNLLRFYERFLAAYEALPLELQRRQAYEATTRRLVADLQSHLNALEATERLDRQAFADDHEQFLPATLCPCIKEPLWAYQVEQL